LCLLDQERLDQHALGLPREIELLNCRADPDPNLRHDRNLDVAAGAQHFRVTRPHAPWSHIAYLRVDANEFGTGTIPRKGGAAALRYVRQKNGISPESRGAGGRQCAGFVLRLANLQRDGSGGPVPAVY
jgi:hypothetical protein